jgi:hypothetical protein
MTAKIKVITAPDVVYDRTPSILVIQPGENLKIHFDRYAKSIEYPINIYIFSEVDTDIQWLLTIEKFADKIIYDMDNSSELVNHFASYLLSNPNTYYKTQHMKAPWNLLNQNRFYDFPNFESEIE